MDVDCFIFRIGRWGKLHFRRFAKEKRKIDRIVEKNRSEIVRRKRRPEMKNFNAEFSSQIFCKKQCFVFGGNLQKCFRKVQLPGQRKNFGKQPERRIDGKW